jgi:hypothetical protein
MNDDITVESDDDPIVCNRHPDPRSNPSPDNISKIPLNESSDTIKSGPHTLIEHSARASLTLLKSHVQNRSQSDGSTRNTLRNRILGQRKVEIPESINETDEADATTVTAIEIRATSDALASRNNKVVTKPLNALQTDNDDESDDVTDDDDDNGIENDDTNNSDLLQCPDCSRSFMEASYAKHIKICKNVFIKKRKKFDSTLMRIRDDPEMKSMAQRAIKEAKKTKSSVQTGSLDNLLLHRSMTVMFNYLTSSIQRTFPRAHHFIFTVLTFHS